MTSVNQQGSEAGYSQQSGQNAEEDVVGYVPRYAIPNISSLLPTYTNSEQDFIHRTFHIGSYDDIRHLPTDIKYQQVIASRTARMEAAREFLLPAISGPLIRSKPSNQQDLFSVFDYQPSQFNIADELASKERVESEAKRIAIGGKEFIPTGNPGLGKQHDIAPGKLFPYLGGPLGSTDEARLAYRALEEAKVLGGRFMSPGTDKLEGEEPTKAASWEMMNNIRRWILQDWADAEITLFENHKDCWVVRIGIESIDSLEGMRAYMNVFVRCNELVNAYRLTKVVEFWHTTPNDGGVYYVFRPPWVRPDTLQTYFAVSPLERHWSTSHAVQEVAKARASTSLLNSQDVSAPQLKKADNNTSKTALSYVSRLEWGTNFLTGTISSKVLSKGIP